MSDQKHIWIVVGTRPNFIKVTRFVAEAKAFPDMEIRIVHTGQHFDEQMATVFFDQFGLRPDRFLDIAPGHPGLQIAEMISKLTQLFTEVKPALVIAVGDVNSTLAAAIAANKSEIPLAHLESGLRSRDAGMPEEHNRKVADELATLHFITEDAGLENLRAEGKREEGLCLVGNTMIDTLVAFQNEISASQIIESLNIGDRPFVLVTMHRPSNVDRRDGLEMVLSVLRLLSQKKDVIFATHPRTAAKIAFFGLLEDFESIQNLMLVPPLGYFDFQHLVAKSAFVLTDSGGIQEETTFLKKPCLTLRPNTERPITIELGSNTLLPFDLVEIARVVKDIDQGNYRDGRIPEMWDGQATGRVLQRIHQYFETGI